MEPEAAGAISPCGFFVSNKTSQQKREIVVADRTDLSFILDLQRRFSNALGFLPKPAVEWYIDNRRVRLAFENAQPAGYVLGRATLRWNRSISPITQAAVEFDAQRRAAGLALVRRVEDEARQEGQSALQAMCREDLDANLFWQAAGFEEIGRYAPQTLRKKEMICWRKLLQINEPGWFRSMPPVAGHKGRSVSTAVQPTLFDYLQRMR